jgi:hypothetical protein
MMKERGRSRARNETRWALAYVRGRARAYDMRQTTLRHVAAAVEMALNRNASLDDVRAALALYDLDWDPVRRTTSDCVKALM